MLFGNLWPCNLITTAWAFVLLELGFCPPGIVSTDAFVRRSSWENRTHFSDLVLRPCYIWRLEAADCWRHVAIVTWRRRWRHASGGRLKLVLSTGEVVLVKHGDRQWRCTDQARRLFTEIHRLRLGRHWQRLMMLGCQWIHLS